MHVYFHHFEQITQIGAEPHVNTLYKHFFYFVTTYNLISQKELDALVSKD